MDAMATLATKRARTTPLTARNPDFGLSARRRAAISVLGRRAQRTISREPAIVSHGPATTRPVMTARIPDMYARIWPGVLGGRPVTTSALSSPKPASSSTARHARGGFGVTRRVTPSGETVTRRNAMRAASTAARGTPTATTPMSTRFSERSLRKNRDPVNGTVATAGRRAKNATNPTTVPSTAATADSTAEMTVIWRGVAPTSRIAANRCSRRAAESRAAAPTKTRIGNSKAAVATASTRSMPLASIPME